MKGVTPGKIEIEGAHAREIMDVLASAWSAGGYGDNGQALRWDAKADHLIRSALYKGARVTLYEPGIRYV